MIQFFAFTEPKNVLKNRASTYRLRTFVSRIFLGQATRSIAAQYYSSFVAFLQTVLDVIPRLLHRQSITNAITDSSNNRNNLSELLLPFPVTSRGLLIRFCFPNPFRFSHRSNARWVMPGLSCQPKATLLKSDSVGGWVMSRGWGKPVCY